MRTADTGSQAASRVAEYNAAMSKPLAVGLLVGAMIAVIVLVDVLFFRGAAWTWERLAVNVGIVLITGAVYYRFLRS